MNSLIASPAVMENLIWGLMALVIVSVFVNLYFFQERMFNKLGKKRALKDLPNMVQKYLNDQAHATKMVPKNQSLGHIESDVIKLRSAYLAIEAKSLDRVVGSDEYWNIINNKVKKLFDILVKQRFSKTLTNIFGKIEAIKFEVDRSDSKEENKKAVFDVLEKFKLACIDNAENPSKLAHYNQKLEALLKKFGDAHYRNLAKQAGAHKEYSDSSDQALQSMRASIRAGELEVRKMGAEEEIEFSRTLDRYRGNNTQLKRGIKNYERDVEEVRSAVDRASSDATITTSHVGSSKSLDDFNEISEKIQQANENEISRLKSLVKDQRLTIAELECAIDKVSPDNPEDQSAVDVEVLKRSLKEAEQCVGMLEDELERLKKTPLQSSSDVSGSADGDFWDQQVSFSDHDISMLQQTIQNLEREVSKGKKLEERYPVLIEFYRESFNALAMEDISLLLHQTLSDLGADTKMIIFAGSRDIEICSSGKIPDRNKILIKSMQINEVNPNHKTGIVVFRFMNYGGMAMPQGGAWEDGQMEIVNDVLKTSDKILGHVKNMQSNRSQKNKIDECANTAKKLAHDIDQSLDDYLQRTKSTIEDTFGQIQDVARARGLNASQIKSFKQMEKEALAMLSADDTIRLKTKKQFLKFIQSVEG